MNADELIDDVARRMTTAQTPPAIRAHVMVAVRAAHQQSARVWLLPVAASASVAAVALTWFMLPAPPLTEVAPVTRQTPAIATASNAAPRQPPAPLTVASSAIAPTGARQTVAVGAGEVAWADALPGDVPTLAPLPNPEPIVIAPVSWSEVPIAPIDVVIAPLDVAITPLIVEPIEVKALAIEPLQAAGNSGV